MAGLDHGGLRAQPAGPGHRHRRVDAEARGPRRSRTAPRCASPPPTMTGVPCSSGRSDQLDRGVERVHVDVQDGAARVVARRSGRRPGPVQLLAAAHRVDVARRRSGPVGPDVQLGGERPGTRAAAAVARLELDQRLGGTGLGVDQRAGHQVGERCGRRAPPRPRSPASPSSAASPASVNRRGSGSPAPHRPSGSSRACRASANRPATARASTTALREATSRLRVPPGRSTAASAASAGAGSSTMLEDAVAEHQVGAAGPDDVEQAGRVALRPRAPRRRPRRRGAAARPARRGWGRPR